MDKQTAKLLPTILPHLNTKTRVMGLIAIIVEVILVSSIPFLNVEDRLTALIICVAVLVIMVIGIFLIERIEISAQGGSKSKSNDLSNDSHLKVLPTKLGITDPKAFVRFYEYVFSKKHDQERLVIFMQGGSLFRVFKPAGYKIGWEPREQEKCIKDIEQLNLGGHIWHHIKQANITKIDFHVLILSPYNSQVSTIREFQQRNKEQNKFAREDIYNTLYSIYLLSVLHDNIKYHVRLLHADPMTYSAHYINDEILIISYLLSSLADGSPYYHLSNSNENELGVFQKYTDAVKAYFSSDKMEDRTIKIDMEEIHKRRPSCYEVFKREIDYYIQSGRYRDINNPHNVKNILYSRYYDKVKSLLEGNYTEVFPVQIEVNISNLCNQNCPWCISENVRCSKEEPKLLSVDDAFAAFLEQFKNNGGEAITWSGGGEPTMHPQYTDAMELVDTNGLKQGLMTNGFYPKELNELIGDYCDWVRFSIDTFSKEKYSKYRGTDKLDHVLDNIRSLVSQNSTRVGININISEWNKDEMQNFYKNACFLEVDYLQIRPVLRTPFQHRTHVTEITSATIDAIYKYINTLPLDGQETELIISHDKFIDLKKRDKANNIYQEIIKYKGCLAHTILPVLNCNGDLSVCMYHLFNSEYTFGNIFQESFEDIWKGAQREKVLAYCRQLNHEESACQLCCKGHEINKVLLSKHKPAILCDYKTKNFL